MSQRQCIRSERGMGYLLKIAQSCFLLISTMSTTAGLTQLYDKVSRIGKCGLSGGGWRRRSVGSGGAVTDNNLGERCERAVVRQSCGS
jgi:hypothetical protein